ncbi:MAG: hypothetical protein EBQ92_00085 [Proteobacteria bacterium]|nr:hypothetical protein [Pseudomonadota bacterium]
MELWKHLVDFTRVGGAGKESYQFFEGISGFTSGTPSVFWTEAKNLEAIRKVPQELQKFYKGHENGMISAQVVRNVDSANYFASEVWLDFFGQVVAELDMLSQEVKNVKDGIVSELDKMWLGRKYS